MRIRGKESVRSYSWKYIDLRVWMFLVNEVAVLAIERIVSWIYLQNYTLIICSFVGKELGFRIGGQCKVQDGCLRDVFR